MDGFDYVIVGGGSAGSVLAYRLAQAGKSVCVLEAGPSDSNPWIRLPAGFIKTLADPAVTWPFLAEPSAWTGGRAITLTQGKVLGGSSAINGAIYNRGQAEDFDAWERRGNPGWGFRDLLPYFMRSECRLGPGDARFRGRDGRLPVTTNHFPLPVAEAFIAGAVACGLPRTVDHNAFEQEGVAYSQAHIRRGVRVSAAHAYLHPARRLGAEVRTHAAVERLLVDGRRVTGVAYRQPGMERERLVHARACVVLAAGAVNSPRLLQLSGIGDPALLRAHGIDLVQALPGVGANLRDHFNARLVARGVPGMDGVNGRVQGWRLAREVLRWCLGRPNALGISPALIHGFGKSDPALATPDYFLVFAPGSYREGRVGMLDDFPGMSCAACTLRPESSGHVHIRSRALADAPLIQPNYLAHEQDRRVLLAGLRSARRILQSAPLQPFVDAETMPGPEVQTDDEWLDFVRRRGTTSYHLAGTCSLGPADDPQAVVDARLRVHGIAGLCVADASVMPTMVSANTCAATLAIAEKAADLLLGRPAPTPPFP